MYEVIHPDYLRHFGKREVEKQELIDYLGSEEALEKILETGLIIAINADDITKNTRKDTKSDKEAK